MSVTTYQAVVEAGQIRLPAGVFLKDQTTVTVLVPTSPDAAPEPTTAERHAEIAAAYGDAIDPEDAATMRMMRKRFARILREDEE